MTRYFILLLVLGLMWGCATSNSDSARRAALHLQLGTAHLNSGNFPAAMAELLKAEKLDSSNPIIQNNLGFAFYVRNKFKEAEEHFAKAVRSKPEYTEARNNLGRVLIDLERYDEAIRELNISVNDLTYSAPEKSLSNLGLAYLKKNDYAHAQENFIKALQIQDKACTTITYYGQSLFGQKKYAAAAETFDRAISSCKKENFDEPYYFSGLSYMRASKREQAVARLEELMQLFPESSYHAKAQTLLEILK